MKKPSAQEALSFAEKSPKTKGRALPKKPAKTAKKVTQEAVKSGLVPEGDVRLSANIRGDIHLKLKIAAATRRTTIGDLLEELIDNNL